MFAKPQRIVCLSAETADWLWRLKAWDIVAGVTAYFESPQDAPPKPKVSGFSSANIESILRLEPDLVLAFSDVQADLAAQLIRHGCQVLTTNQRTLEEIESTLALLARCTDRIAAGEKLLQDFRKKLAPEPAPTRRPRVYFEEWDDPFVTGIAWVSELIDRAGGADVFGSQRSQKRALDRTVTSEQILSAQPDIILASWCGKPVSVAEIAARPGWSSLPAVQHNRIHEISSADILQPGFNLIHGYDRIKQIIQSINLIDFRFGVG